MFNVSSVSTFKLTLFKVTSKSDTLHSSLPPESTKRLLALPLILSYPSITVCNLLDPSPIETVLLISPTVEVIRLSIEVNEAFPAVCSVSRPSTLTVISSKLSTKTFSKPDLFLTIGIF